MGVVLVVVVVEVDPECVDVVVVALDRAGHQPCRQPLSPEEGTAERAQCPAEVREDDQDAEEPR